MFRFIKVFIITYIILFVIAIIITGGITTDSMIGGTGQVAMVNTILWCILKPKFTK